MEQKDNFNDTMWNKIVEFIEEEGKFKVYERWVDEREVIKE